MKANGNCCSIFFLPNHATTALVSGNLKPGDVADKIDWSKSYSLPFLCTRDFKLRIFQSKLLHRRISTNRYLFKIGLNANELCSFCENSSETLLHLFWECPQVKILWNDVQKWLGNFLCFKTKSFSLQLCLGIVDDTTDFLFHQALLISRYQFFWAKSMHHLPSRELFIRNFLTCLDVERRFSLKNGLPTKFHKNGELSSLNKKTSTLFVQLIFILFKCCLPLQVNVQRTADFPILADI